MAIAPLTAATSCPATVNVGEDEWLQQALPQPSPVALARPVSSPGRLLCGTATPSALCHATATGKEECTATTKTWESRAFLDPSTSSASEDARFHEAISSAFSLQHLPLAVLLLDGAQNRERVAGSIQTAIRDSADMGKSDDRPNERSCRRTHVTKRSRSVPCLDAASSRPKELFEPDDHGTLPLLHIHAANSGRGCTPVHIAASTTCSSLPNSKNRTPVHSKVDQSSSELPGDKKSPPSGESMVSGNSVLSMLKVGVSGAVGGVAVNAACPGASAHGPGVSALPPLPSRLPLQANSNQCSDLDAEAIQHKMMSASAAPITTASALHLHSVSIPMGLTHTYLARADGSLQHSV